MDVVAPESTQVFDPPVACHFFMCYNKDGQVDQLLL